MKKIIGAIFLWLLFLSCNNPISRVVSVNFQIDYEDYENLPVIYLKTDCFEGPFLVDSGASHNIFASSGDFSPFFNGNVKRIIVTGLSEFSDYQIEFYVDADLKGTYIKDSTQVIGILGQPFLRLFSTATFNYHTGKLILNDRPIHEKQISFIQSDEYPSFLFIPYFLENFSEVGLVDTGCAGYVIRRSFSDENHNLFGRGESDIVFDKVDIGGIQYTNISAFTPESTDIKTNEKALKFLNQNSSLGYTFWKDHVIQLDFENNVFRIK